MGKPGPISTLICLAAAILTVVVSLICLPAAELLPAQVFPAKRDSGESLVQTLPGAHHAMKFYGEIGVQIMKMLPLPQPAADDKKPVMQDWQTKLMTDNGEKYGTELKGNIASKLGGDENLKTVLELLPVNKNVPLGYEATFVYNAYALFLGLALFAGAVAIQAMGRWGAEEKTILPVKK